MRVLLVYARRDLAPGLLEALDDAVGGVVWVSTVADARALAERGRPRLAVVGANPLQPALLRGLDGLAEGGILLVAPTVAQLEAAFDQSEILDVVAGLDRVEEIVFRTRVALRRLEAGEGSAPERRLHLRVGCVELLRPQRALRVGCDGETRMLTTGEGVVLERLLTRRGAIVSREELSWAVTARPALPESRGIDSIVSRLRRKLRCRNGCADGAIRAVRSRGYRLE